MMRILIGAFVERTGKSETERGVEGRFTLFRTFFGSHTFLDLMDLVELVLDDVWENLTLHLNFFSKKQQLLTLNP